MAQYKAVKVISEGKTLYGIGQKVNTYCPNMGRYETRQEAVFHAELANVAHFEELKQEAYDKALKAAKNVGHTVRDREIMRKDENHFFDIGDCCC